MARKTQRDARITRDGENRQERSNSDREITSDRELTDAERLDSLRSSFFQTSLPNLPKIPGFHVCWLTTQNPRDPIHGRMRLGYTPIKSTDIPGWEHSAIKSGEWEGCVGVNEMLAFKLPEHLYQQYMREVHHLQPAAEEEKLAEMARAASDKARRINSNARVDIEEGTAELGRAPPRAAFAD